MNIFDAIWLGIIEGVTEFIPVSSTGHLIVLSEFLGIEQNNVNKAFEIIIQFAAIMALFFKSIKSSLFYRDCSLDVYYWWSYIFNS